jgi:RNA exonuclease 1
MSTDDQGSYKGILGIDCEMVKTTKGPELARVSLITDSGEILYDEFVIPEFPVLDYLTQFSGITPSLLNSATKTLELVQKDLKTLINSSSVLCGHSLENDLKSLKLIHTRVCDTSLLFPHKFAGRRLSLKSLSTQYLNRSIQTVLFTQKGHNSVEDAQATLDLLKLKLKHGVSFGVPSCIFHESNLFKEISEKNVKSVVLGSFLPRDLVQGSLSVDLRGSLEKYVHGNFRLVVALFDALKKVDNENWDQEVEGILKKWDHDLKKVVQTVDNGIVVLMNGQGNVALAEK